MSDTHSEADNDWDRVHTLLTDAADELIPSRDCVTDARSAVVMARDIAAQHITPSPKDGAASPGREGE